MVTSAPSHVQTFWWLVSDSPGFNDDFFESPCSLIFLESPEHHQLPGLCPLSWSLDGGGELRTGLAACVKELGTFRLFSAAAPLQESPPPPAVSVRLISPQNLYSCLYSHHWLLLQLCALAVDAQRLIPSCMWTKENCWGIECCSQALAEWGIKDRWCQLVTARMQNWWSWPCSMKAEMVRWRLHLQLEQKVHWPYLLFSEDLRQDQPQSKVVSLLSRLCPLPC